MTRRTAAALRAAYSGPMEWMLQVVDEIDDAIGAVKHGWLGLNAEFGLLWAASVFTAMRNRGAHRRSQPSAGTASTVRYL